MDKKKKELLEGAIKNLEKEYGKGVIMRLGDEKIVKVDFIPTGSMGLDHALGIGGFPRGRVTEIYGPESSGKTTLTLHAIAEAQKMGGLCAFVDAEHAFDPAYAEKIGVNVKDLYMSQPSSGEQALEVVDELVSTASLDLIVIDSVAALVPQAEIDGNMGDAQMGLHARLMSQALRKLTGAVSKSNTAVIFINQMRSKIGGYGNPETTTGGNALKFYASVRLDIRKASGQESILKNGSQVYGNVTKVKVVKNKLAPPFREVFFEIHYGKGIARALEVVAIAVEKSVIKKGGSFYSFGAKRLGQGLDKVETFLLENKDVLTEIEQNVSRAME